MKGDDVIFALLGLVTIAAGIRVMGNRVLSSLKYGAFDFGPAHQLIGAGLMLFGIFAIYSVARKL